MQGDAQKCAKRCCEVVHKSVDELYKVSSPCLDDHQINTEDFESVGEFSETSSRLVFKCLYVARIERPNLLRTVNYHARSVK